MFVKEIQYNKLPKLSEQTLADYYFVGLLGDWEKGKFMPQCDIIKAYPKEKIDPLCRKNKFPQDRYPYFSMLILKEEEK